MISRYRGSSRAAMSTAVPTYRPWRRPRVRRLWSVGSYGRPAGAGTVLNTPRVATATTPAAIHRLTVIEAPHGRGVDRATTGTGTRGTGPPPQVFGSNATDSFGGVTETRLKHYGRVRSPVNHRNF